MTSELKPVSPPLAVYPALVRNEPTSILLKEASIHNTDTYTVKNTLNGDDLFKVEIKSLSLHERKHVTDLAGKVLFSIHQKLASKTVVVEDEAGTEVVVVNKQHVLDTQLAGTFSHGGRTIEINVSGDFWGGSASLQLPDGTLIAHIARGVAPAGNLFVDKSTYFVSVAPGVDIALITALSIALESARAT